jgi:hypothetical protein
MGSLPGGFTPSLHFGTLKKEGGIHWRRSSWDVTTNRACIIDTDILFFFLWLKNSLQSVSGFLSYSFFLYESSHEETVLSAYNIKYSSFFFF